MIEKLTVVHHVHVTDRPFDQVLAAFKAATGSVEDGFDRVAASAINTDQFVAAFRAREGSSGFMRFLPIDHGSWLAKFDRPAKAIMYILGNPLIAITMLEHDIGAGLNVPVRLYVFEDNDGKTRVAYDLPSTLMGNLGNQALTAAARQLDVRIVNLAEQITGVAA